MWSCHREKQVSSGVWSNRVYVWHCHGWITGKETRWIEKISFFGAAPLLQGALTIQYVSPVAAASAASAASAAAVVFLRLRLIEYPYLALNPNFSPLKWNRGQSKKQCIYILPQRPSGKRNTHTHIHTHTYSLKWLLHLTALHEIQYLRRRTTTSPDCTTVKSLSVICHVKSVRLDRSKCLDFLSVFFLL